MAWAVTFLQDTVNEGVGTLTATNGSFSLSKRVDTTNSGQVTGFVNQAKSQHSAYSAGSANKLAIEAAVLAKLEA